MMAQVTAAALVSECKAPRASGVRRLDPDVRGQGGPRLDVADRGAQARGDRREPGERARDRAARRRSRRWSSCGPCARRAPIEAVRQAFRRIGPRLDVRPAARARPRGVAPVSFRRAGRRGCATGLRARSRRRGRRPLSLPVYFCRARRDWSAPPAPSAPPGALDLRCLGWAQEAALRMLENNLDPEVAEKPEELIVYGGRGKAARDWPSLRQYRRDSPEAARRRDASRPVGQAGRRLRDPRRTLRAS